MKRISVLPNLAIATVAAQRFNPNLERHIKELGQFAETSTTIQASGGINYVQNGAQIVINLNATTVTAGSTYELPALPAFDSFLNEYVTVGSNTTLKFIALAAGSKTIALDAGDAVIVSGSYISKLEGVS